MITKYYDQTFVFGNIILISYYGTYSMTLMYFWIICICNSKQANSFPFRKLTMTFQGINDNVYHP